LHDNVELISHVVVAGRTEIGAGTRIFPFASIGHQPQDLKYQGEPSRLYVGERCIIRENVTINPGTLGGSMETRVGDDCLLMASSHVAHDCRVGNHVVLANYVGLAGHSVIGDYVAFGGTCVVHQFVRIGAHAFIGAQSMVDADVIPYGMAVGNRAKLAGLNLIGLKRRKFDREAIHTLRAAYRMIFSSEGALRERVEDAATMFKDEPLVQDIVNFITASTDRPLCLPRNGAGED
ncbi:MAG TPA: acyl-ACP--UDP-N-acetylglucosamine O-acyltransferase, partial [Alphaproteobacteria bacterium]|nr:acyl-ACP--UDP-N-acetylglucosamine O-acyltransferase [Alphaproteobacteria bacterium]